MPFQLQQLLTCFAFSLLFAGCAASVKHVPANLIAITGAPQPLHVTLNRQVDIRLDTGYTRILKAGSEWQRAGRIAQGDVYKPYNGIFTLEGAHIHEAWLVVANGRLTGFYLPVERGFSAIARTIDLPLSSTPDIREQ